MRRSLIIGFTPYHSHVAAGIIDQLDGHIVCAFTKRWPNCLNPYQKLGLMQRDLLGSWRNAFMVIHFFLLLNWWRITRQSIDAYIPHPGHLLTNPVFWLNSPRVKLYLYEDGLLNYYDATALAQRVNWGQKLVALMFGYRLRACIGHLSGCDEKPYEGAYLSQPDKAVRRGRLGQIKRLPSCGKTFTPQPNTVLFLDQNTTDRLTATQRVCALEILFKAYPSDRFHYIYKPHHDYESALQSTMQPLQPELSRMPAELLVDTLHPSHVVSFYSSALMNIKRSHPWVHCISVGAEHIAIERDGSRQTLKSLFLEMQVTCL